MSLLQLTERWWEVLYKCPHWRQWCWHASCDRLTGVNGAQETLEHIRPRLTKDYPDVQFQIVRVERTTESLDRG